MTTMNMTCLIKGHILDGCICRRCQKRMDVSHPAHVWNGCVCARCGAVRDEGHDWETVTRRHCSYSERGSGPYNDPCYGASCSDCDEEVLVCKRCGMEKRT